MKKENRKKNSRLKERKRIDNLDKLNRETGVREKERKGIMNKNKRKKRN
jgi:hypothetical protein